MPSEAPSAWAGPRGDLTVTVVSASGKPLDGTCLLGSIDLELEWWDPIRSGTCVYKQLPAVTWSLRIDYEDGADNGTVFTDVVVTAGRLERVTVTVEDVK